MSIRGDAIMHKDIFRGLILHLLIATENKREIKVSKYGKEVVPSIQKAESLLVILTSH